LDAPEIWCYDFSDRHIYKLQPEAYVEKQTSSIFPEISIKEIPRIVEQNRYQGKRKMRKAVKYWIQ
jgi:hypothetical protein